MYNIVFNKKNVRCFVNVYEMFSRQNKINKKKENLKCDYELKQKIIFILLSNV